ADDRPRLAVDGRCRDGYGRTYAAASPDDGAGLRARTAAGGAGSGFASPAGRRIGSRSGALARKGRHRQMDNDQLALRIRAFRKLKGMTQQQLADRLGVSVAVLGSLERGTRKPETKLLTRIAETLGVSYEELTAEGPGNGA